MMMYYRSQQNREVFRHLFIPVARARAGGSAYINCEFPSSAKGRRRGVVASAGGRWKSIDALAIQRRGGDELLRGAENKQVIGGAAVIR